MERESWFTATETGETGPDATFVGEGKSPGFRYAELKPYSKSGISQFGSQLQNWEDDYEGETALFFYDETGEIFWSGFIFN